MGFSILILAFLIEFTELMRKVSLKPHIEFSILLKMLFFKVPSLLQEIFPFIILFAAMMTLWSLNRYQEITIMKATGLSIWQILRPLLIFTWVLGSLDLAFFQPMTSKMMKYYESLENQYLHKVPHNFIISESGLWMQEREGEKKYIYHIGFIDQQDLLIRDFSIFEYRNNQFFQRIIAKTARFQEKGLMLEIVWSQILHHKPKFQENFYLPSHLSLHKIQQPEHKPSNVSIWELPGIAQKYEFSGLSGLKYMMYWHSLFARWIWLGIMVLIAAACSLRSLRQGGMTTLLSLGVLSAFLLYFLRDITYALGNSGTLPIILAAWIPVGISAFLGITVLLYFEEG